MREIKFRGKDIENDNPWRYGSLITYPSGCTSIIGFDKLGNELNHDVDPDTVGQFTGLKDKSGKEIYEGDILNNGQRNYAVYWNSELGAWWLKNKDLIYTTPLGFLSIEQFVIGSVYDNLELLKGGSNEE